MTTEQDAPIFNPLDPGFRINPYPVYKRLREEQPVHLSPFGAWIFTRYEDCVAILKDPRGSSDPMQSTEVKSMFDQGMFDADQQAFMESRSFLFLDPPDHTRLRGLVSKAFTPRVVEELRPRIQQRVDELLDAVVEKGSLEVIEDLAYPLPVYVICEMLGVPAEDNVMFREWSREAARSLDPVEALPPDVAEKRRQVSQHFRSYFDDLIRERRKDPKDDLLSALIAAEEAGDKLSHEELLSTCILLLIAGHETTVNLIGNGSLALLTHRDQLQKLIENPGLVRGAVEEVLRYDPPVQFTGRVATEPMEVGGVTVEQGQQTITLVGAANRDPAQFDDPEELDIERADNRHIAFGFGIHFCLGAPLARLEGEIALGTMVRRLQGLELQTEAPEYKENIVLRGLESLPVGFASAT